MQANPLCTGEEGKNWLFQEVIGRENYLFSNTILPAPGKNLGAPVAGLSAEAAQSSSYSLRQSFSSCQAGCSFLSKRWSPRTR
jgi:hypothetical protein